MAEGEWGLSLDDVGGRPLHVGVAAADGLLRLQAAVCGPGLADPHALLHRNRTLSLVRFAHTRAGEVWLVGDTPLEHLDRALGILVQAAEEVRATPSHE